jgi:hypothetical protein
MRTTGHAMRQTTRTFHTEKVKEMAASTPQHDIFVNATPRTFSSTRNTAPSGSVHRGASSTSSTVTVTCSDPDMAPLVTVTSTGKDRGWEGLSTSSPARATRSCPVPASTDTHSAASG